MSGVHFVLPADMSVPTGGNVYDARICEGLAALGWTVHRHAAGPVDALPDGALVLVDGLVASEELLPHARRLRLVVLLHMPVGGEGERRVLSAAAAVVTTSEWSRWHVIDVHGLDPRRVHVAVPGVDPAPLASPSEAGSNLLCVGVVAYHKGHDLLIEALAKVSDLAWECRCIGALNREPEFVRRLLRQAREHGVAGRITFGGPRTGAELDAAYADCDLLVLPSRGESYGMVVTEALARGIAVVGTDVQGLPEALGSGGMLVAPDDAGALAEALRGWLTRPALRQRLRQAARRRRTELTGWETTSMAIVKVLETYG